MRTAILWLGFLVVGNTSAADAAHEVERQAQRVMQAIAADDAGALEATMSPYMIANASAEELLALARRRRMHEFTKVTWNDPRVAETIARLEGMGTLRDGGNRWLNMRFVKRDVGWRLALIGVENADIIDEPAALDVPPAQTIFAMLENVQRDFVEGLKRKRFDRLVASMPSSVAEQVDPDVFSSQLLAAVRRQDYAEALGLAPVLDAPASIDEDGILWLQGHYATTVPVRFRHGFQKERGDWRLLRFSIDPPNRPHSTARD